MNHEVLKGIDLVIEGLTTVRKALSNVGEIPVIDTIAEVINEVTVEKDGTVVVGKHTVEELQAMKYNDFKKLAASLGVKCTGTRDEIMKRILELEENPPIAKVEKVEEVTEAETEVEETPVEEEKAPTPKSDKPSVGKKISKAKVEEPTKDEFDEQAEEIAKDTSIEEIIEALAEVEVKATKKTAIEKLAYALREGLIELDEEDEEEEEEYNPDVDETAIETDEDEEEVDEEEISATSYFAEFDPKGFNNPKDMTPERAEAVETKMDEILTAYSEGDLKDDDITSYVEDNATEEEIELLGDDYTEEDVLKLYMELIKRTIDNEGEEHEQGDPYEVADKDVCCGHELKYSSKTKQYICEHCGTEYEAE